MGTGTRYLRLAASGFGLGAATAIPMGHFAAVCHRHRREDCVQHFALCRHSRVPHPAARVVPQTGVSMSMDSLTHLTLGQFLISPGLWIGLAIAAAFLAAAVRLRRYREPI